MAIVKEKAVKQLMNALELKREIERLESKLEETGKTQLERKLAKKRREWEDMDKIKINRYAGFIINKKMTEKFLKEKGIDPFEMMYKQFKEKGSMVIKEG